jgi:hypothetical protein
MKLKQTTRQVTNFKALEKQASDNISSICLKQKHKDIAENVSKRLAK